MTMIRRELPRSDIASSRLTSLSHKNLKGVMSDNEVGVGDTATQHGSNSSACHQSVDGGASLTTGSLERLNQLVTDALMVPLAMVVRHELG